MDRRHGTTGRWTLLLWGTLLGCGGTVGQVTEADLEAPMAKVAGVWIPSGGSGASWTFEQNGDQVTALFPAWTFKGRMTGRVLRGLSMAGTDLAWVFSEDGLAVKYYSWHGEAPVTLCREVVGPSAKHPLLKDDPSLWGGVVAQRPVRNDGGVWLVPSAGDPVREVLVTLHYNRRDPDGAIIPERNMVALREPRHLGALINPDKPELVNNPGSWTRGLDLPALREARKGWPVSIKRRSTLEGKPCWWIIAPLWQRVNDLKPSHLIGELYWQDPDLGAPPADVTLLADRDSDGTWRSPGRYYLLEASKPTKAWAVMENGQPVRIETAEVPEPPLKDILVAKEQLLMFAKYRNRLTIDAKNKTLPRVLQESKTSELVDWVGQIEKTLLEVSHEGELAKDKAQKEIEANRPADLWREMALVYRERIEVLKPILSAIKDEISTRGK